MSRGDEVVDAAAIVRPIRRSSSAAFAIDL
jgi:hypothetical protein